MEANLLGGIAGKHHTPRVLSISPALQEKNDYLEVVREVWAMQLDATRNRIIRIDLIVAIASFAMIMPTVPAAFFGMNTVSGYEEATGVFWPIVYCSLTASGLTFLAVYSFTFSPELSGPSYHPKLRVDCVIGVDFAMQSASSLDHAFNSN